MVQFVDDLILIMSVVQYNLHQDDWLTVPAHIAKQILLNMQVIFLYYTCAFLVKDFMIIGYILSRTEQGYSSCGLLAMHFDFVQEFSMCSVLVYVHMH